MEREGEKERRERCVCCISVVQLRDEKKKEKKRMVILYNDQWNIESSTRNQKNYCKCIGGVLVFVEKLTWSSRHGGR